MSIISRAQLLCTEIEKKNLLCFQKKMHDKEIKVYINKFIDTDIGWNWNGD